MSSNGLFLVSFDRIHDVSLPLLSVNATLLILKTLRCCSTGQYEGDIMCRCDAVWIFELLYIGSIMRYIDLGMT